RIDRVPEEDVALRTLDVAGGELCGVEAVSLVDELRQPCQRRVVGILLRVVLEDEARRGLRDAIAALEALGRLLVAVREQVMVEPLPGVRVVRQVRQDVVGADLDPLPGPLLVDGVLERARSDSQRALLRPRAVGGKPRRGCEGVLLLRRRAAEPRLPADALQISTARLPLRRSD